jgi:hypothetical protein
MPVEEETSQSLDEGANELKSISLNKSEHWSLWLDVPECLSKPMCFAGPAPFLGEPSCPFLSAARTWCDISEWYITRWLAVWSSVCCERDEEVVLWLVCTDYCAGFGFCSGRGEGVPLPLPFSAPLPQESSFIFIRFPNRPLINQKAWNARASHFLVWNVFVAKNATPNKNALARLFGRQGPRQERGRLV